MEELNKTDHLLAHIISHSGEELAMDREIIDAELEKDANTYQGLGIKALSIAGGLLASLFFFIFLGLTLHNSDIAMIVFGVIAILASVLIDGYVKNRVLDSACFGSYLSGMAMLGGGLDGITRSDNLVVFCLLFTAIATMIWTRSYILNLFAILIANGCLYAFGQINHLPNYIHFFTGFVAIAYTVLHLKEAEFLAMGTKINVRYNPIADGFLISFFAILIDFCFKISRSTGNNWISALVIILIILFVVHQVIVFLELEKKQILIYLLSLLVLVPIIFAPTICGAILILLVGFYTGQKFGLALGIIGLIYFVGQFYYDLQYSLLIKSGMMLGTGILFLAAWFILSKQLKMYEQN